MSVRSGNGEAHLDIAFVADGLAGRCNMQNLSNFRTGCEMNEPAGNYMAILVKSEDGLGHEQSPGFIVYGLGSPGGIVRDPPENVLDDRPVTTFRLIGENWEVIMWEYPFKKEPAHKVWQNTVSRLLESMICAGARVAWIGAEIMPYSDPPTLFDPDYMEGGVPVWMTSDGGKGGSLDLDKPFVPASTAQLLALRSYAAGLADVD
jgi:hypothetical protein